MGEEKKKHSFLRFIIKTLIAGGIAYAGYLVYKKTQPQEDPWAESYWEEATVDTEETADTAQTPETNE
ncbi:MAG: hypothetical protein J6M18_06975 [Actinomycetaceae bacterium]|nr:hypothetical protein [Actinomycetaceae bacterium]